MEQQMVSSTIAALRYDCCIEAVPFAANVQNVNTIAAKPCDCLYMVTGNQVVISATVWTKV